MGIWGDEDAPDGESRIMGNADGRILLRAMSSRPPRSAQTLDTSLRARPVCSSAKTLLIPVPCSYRQRMTIYERCAHITINPPRPNPSCSPTQLASLHHLLRPLPSQLLDHITKRKSTHQWAQCRMEEDPDVAYRSPTGQLQKVARVSHPSNRPSWPRDEVQLDRWIPFRQIDQCRLRHICILPLGEGSR